MQVFSAIADVAGALAIGTGVVTLVLLLTGDRSARGVRPAVGLDVDPFAMSVHGRF
jgi:hypothetical protein